MKIKIIDHENGAARVIDYPGTVLLFIQVHFGAWGFYKVVKTARDHFEIYDKFTCAHVHTVTKAKKGV